MGQDKVSNLNLLVMDAHILELSIGCRFKSTWHYNILQSQLQCNVLSFCWQTTYSSPHHHYCIGWVETLVMTMMEEQVVAIEVVTI